MIFLTIMADNMGVNIKGRVTDMEELAVHSIPVNLKIRTMDQLNANVRRRNKPVFLFIQNLIHVF